jgi:hypothetical protein
MVKAKAAGAAVANVIAGSLTFFVDDAAMEQQGGGYLMQDVYVRFNVTSQTRCKGAFRALFALHAVGFAHGDARLPNLMALPQGRGKRDTLVWIDLRESTAGDALPFAQRIDALTLAKSILMQKTGALPETVKAAVANIPQGAEAAYEALAVAIWDIKNVPV